MYARFKVNLGEFTVINFDNVEVIMERDEGSIIFFESGNSLSVMETLREVTNILNEDRKVGRI